MQLHGWTLLFHDCLTDQLCRLHRAVQRAPRRDPKAFVSNANVKLFYALSQLMPEVIRRIRHEMNIAKATLSARTATIGGAPKSADGFDCSSAMTPRLRQSSARGSMTSPRFARQRAETILTGCSPECWRGRIRLTTGPHWLPHQGRIGNQGNERTQAAVACEGVGTLLRTLRDFNSFSAMSGVRVRGGWRHLPGPGGTAIRRRGGNPYPEVGCRQSDGFPQPSPQIIPASSDTRGSRQRLPAASPPLLTRTDSGRADLRLPAFELPLQLPVPHGRRRAGRHARFLEGVRVRPGTHRVDHETIMDPRAGNQQAGGRTKGQYIRQMV